MATLSELRLNMDKAEDAYDRAIETVNINLTRDAQNMAPRAQWESDKTLAARKKLAAVKVTYQAAQRKYYERGSVAAKVLAEWENADKERA